MELKLKQILNVITLIFFSFFKAEFDLSRYIEINYISYFGILG